MLAAVAWLPPVQSPPDTTADGQPPRQLRLVPRLRGASRGGRPELLQHLGPLVRHSPVLLPSVAGGAEVLEVRRLVEAAARERDDVIYPTTLPAPETGGLALPEVENVPGLDTAGLPSSRRLGVRFPCGVSGLDLPGMSGTVGSPLGGLLLLMAGVIGGLGGHQTLAIGHSVGRIVGSLLRPARGVPRGVVVASPSGVGGVPGGALGEQFLSMRGIPGCLASPVRLGVLVSHPALQMERPASALRASAGHEERPPQQVTHPLYAFVGHHYELDLKRVD